MTFDEILSKAHITTIKMLEQKYDDMTNGDVIKAMFPNAEYKHIKTMSGIEGIEVKGINGLYDNLGQWCARDIFFHDDWWNAPYQKGAKNDSKRDTCKHKVLGI